jgi:hypothetical protein
VAKLVMEERGFTANGQNRNLAVEKAQIALS